MATNIVKTSLGIASKRGYSLPAPQVSSSAPAINCTVLPNKALVSSLDLCRGLSRVSLIFRTGTRNETPETLGFIHYIRALIGFASTKTIGFILTRNIQQLGAWLSVTSDREVTAFNLVASRNQILRAMDFLGETASCPAYKPWHIRDITPSVEYQARVISPAFRAVDMLHKAAFKTGLGNSLVIKKDHLGEVTQNDLLCFHSKSFTANRCSFVGYNIDHRDLIDFAKCISLGSGDPPQGNGEYFGGELRKEKNSHFSTVAIGTRSSGLNDLQSSLAFSVLKYAYGTEPVTPWGNSPSPIFKCLFELEGTASCFNMSYSDNGLFGVVISSNKNNVRKIFDNVVKVLKSGIVSDADVQRGKALLKHEILSNWENTQELVHNVGVQSLFSGCVIPAPAFVEAIDKLSTADISAAAKKVADGKLSFAGFGNMDNLPYLDQIK